MATGAGKTFTACTFSYRLLKHAKSARILFLVDRNNLGDQTLREYQRFEPPGTLERKRTVPFGKLMDQIAQGRRVEDAISRLAARLAALDKRIGNPERERIKQATGGLGPRNLAKSLLEAIDPDTIAGQVKARFGELASEEQTEQVEADLLDEACRPFDNPNLRKLLADIKQSTEILIDEITTDQVTAAGYDLHRAEETIKSFRAFIDANKDELLALQILYSRPCGTQRLTYAAIKELALRLTDPPHHLTTADVWQTYRRLESSLVRGAPSDKVLTDIIALVRFATGQAEVLESYSAQVEQRFNLWIGRQIEAGRSFGEEQMQWLRAIKDYLAANVEIAPADLMRDHPFSVGVSR